MALKWFVVSVALLTGLMLVSTAGAQQAAVKSAPPRATLNTPAMGVPVASDYIIGPEDMLQVSIWKNEAMSRTLPVRPAGTPVQPPACQPPQVRYNNGTCGCPSGTRGANCDELIVH